MKECEKKDCTDQAILIADKSQPVRYIKQVPQRGEPSFTIGYPVKSGHYCYLHSKESAIKEADEFREKRRLAEAERQVLIREKMRRYGR